MKILRVRLKTTVFRNVHSAVPKSAVCVGKECRVQVANVGDRVNVEYWRRDEILKGGTNKFPYATILFPFRELVKKS